ncbi:MAG: glycoside hydrolase family 3 protein, partial [Polyangiaceae bacterium]
MRGLLGTLAAGIALLVVVSACDQGGTIVLADDVGLPPPAPYTGPAADVEARVEWLLGQMTLDEKAGQMTMGGWTSLQTPDQIATGRLGALGGAPGNLDAHDWLGIAATVRAEAAATRMGIPVMFAIDAVHGNGKVRGATIFPHNVGLGCTGDPDLVREVYAATASEVAGLGFAMNEAPAVDVGRDLRWGRSYESFGEDPALVSTMAAAAVAGTQTAVLACAKHLLGAGGTTWGTGVAGGIDRGDAELPEAEMRRVHLPPFQAAIAAGVQAIMVSYSEWQGTRMCVDGHWLTDVVKGELGFDGILMTDGGGVLLVGPDIHEDVLEAVNAGIDVVNVGAEYGQVVDAIVALAQSGDVPMSRIDDAVRRILRVKIRGGLFEAPAPDATSIAQVGSAAHRAVARRAVAESLVLLRNEAGLLPLPKSARVRVLGPGANDLGIQSGGWTLGWQGGTGVDANGLGGGTTILDAMRATASSPSLVTYSRDGSDTTGSDVVVVVLHERPYAEYFGDTPDPRLDGSSPPDVLDGTAGPLVAAARTAHVPLVALLLTGRPVRVESLLASFDAVVAAWLPGSEGQG